jgi:hypothetical protein
VGRSRRAKHAKVKYDFYDGDIHVGEEGSFGWDPLGEPIGSLEAVGDASLTQLRDALKKAGQAGFAVSRDSAKHFDAEYASADDTSFEFKGGRLLTKIEGFLGGYSDDESDALERLITNYLSERRAAVEFFEAYTYSGDTHVSLTYEAPYYGRSVRDVAALAYDAKALLSAAVTGRIGQSSALDLILGGHAEALVGLYESSWLEAKRAPYDLTDVAQKLELALDVAALANSETGGLLVVGLATKNDSRGDRVVGVTPTKPELIDRRKYRQHLDRLIYPAVAGLDLHLVSHGSEGLALLAVEIPSQAEQVKPFLVGGTLIQGKLRGSYFTVATRRDDSRMVASPAEIHGLLAAGRLATRLEEQS